MCALLTLLFYQVGWRLIPLMLWTSTVALKNLNAVSKKRVKEKSLLALKYIFFCP